MTPDPAARETRALDRVHRARRDHVRAEEAFRKAIRGASRSSSIRKIAEAAGLSPTRVHQIIHGRNR